MQEAEEKTTDVFYHFRKRDILKENGLRRNGKGRIRMSMAKQDNYKKERTETALSFHFSDFGMRGYISMVKPSGLFLRFSFSFW